MSALLAKLVHLAKTEPVLVTGLVQSLLSLIVGLGLPLTAAEAGGVLAVTSALLAFLAAWAVRPFQVATLTGLVTAVVTTLVAFGVPHVSTGIVSSLNASIVAILSLVLRGHVTPVANLPAPAPAPVAPPAAA
jgi:hypothetical protein